MYEKGTEQALQELVESRGHILILSPKCHPELAGCSIENSWGKSNMISANLHSNIHSSIQLNVLPIERIWKFEQKSRNYRRMYKKDAGKNVADGVIDQKDISCAGLELKQAYFVQIWQTTICEILSATSIFWTLFTSCQNERYQIWRKTFKYWSECKLTVNESMGKTGFVWKIYTKELS